MKLEKLVYNMMPISIKSHLMREKVCISEGCYDPELIVKIANTPDELMQAYQLLYQAYLDAKLMDPNDYKVRCNLYTFLPTTYTLIVKKKGEVVGTVCIIKDTYFGLPSDKEFKKVNDELRQEFQNLVEISALAVKKEHRYADHRVYFLMLKYIHQFCTFNLKCRQIICVAHPKTEAFYGGLMNLKRNGDIVKYDFVNGALGMHMSKIVDEKTDLEFSQISNNNFFRYLMEKDSRIQIPPMKDDQIALKVMNTQLFTDILKKSGLNLKSFNRSELMALVSIYGQKILTSHPNIQFDHILQFRYPLKKRVLVQTENLICITHIHNISETGAYIGLECVDQLGVNATVEIKFEHDGKKHLLKGIIRWINQNQSDPTLPVGFGLEFESKFKLLNQIVSSWDISEKDDMSQFSIQTKVIPNR